MEQFLVLTAQCPDEPAIAGELAKLTATSGCNILTSQMTVLGSEFAVIIYLSGTWDAVAKFEQGLAALTKRLHLQTTLSRTQLREHEQDLLPYSVQVIGLDVPGSTHKLTEFFVSHQVSVDQLCTETYATNSGTKMSAVSMTINIPANAHIASIRESFLVFCDDNNLDALIEPVKA